ncbi:ABC transporter ATP-binding protein [Halobacillus litoralis]|uniref:ABC transporter ATP-binding protein n=1 Tax=Halobacillus litoralis TaxID=45668 RepID=UPI001CD6900F|nr:ABC transporter ATP-binding protein [Halobacillus litoralis]MCA0970544.1 ABC transporter ATP-binding protein [Halobacillus litoralis]
MIQLENVHKAFKGKKALDGLNVQVTKGEIFGFLGPSGSGKTTTIKILTGQLKADSGVVRVFNNDTQTIHDSDQLQRIGIMTDNSSLYPRLTVQDNLNLYCQLYRVPIRRVKEVLEMVNLEGVERKKVSTLSKGMHQRIILARALLHEPELLFLDEPTAALDPINKEKIHQGLRKLKERGTTIFLTTHDMDEAETLCDRVALLNAGRVVEEGSPATLCQRFSEPIITVQLKGGQTVTFENAKESAKAIYDCLLSEQVVSIHTDEPSLGQVFIQVTGRNLA